MNKNELTLEDYVERAPREGVPPTAAERNRIRDMARAHVVAVNLRPPLAYDKLRSICLEQLKKEGLPEEWVTFAAVVMNNAVWEDEMKGIPPSRRLLLLPKCLRDGDRCSAKVDEVGLYCNKCGLCSIPDITVRAEALGYTVLTAEGSAPVIEILKSGKVDAVVGVSCLDVLEKIFPVFQMAGIPGMAVPILDGDCKSGEVDLDWLEDTIRFGENSGARPLIIDNIKAQVRDWFERPVIDRLFGDSSSDTDEIVRDYLAGPGKRWRPFLLATAWQAIADQPDRQFNDDVIRLALAVECFHKASLIHDDIEDDDESRYGEPTLHAVHGLAVALNAGDYLLGEGYRLISLTEISPELKSRIFTVASEGHHALALGQGNELFWAAHPTPLNLQQTVDIFELKTAPAFDVAIRMGAILAGADEQLVSRLKVFSKRLGTAYQIQDDMDDFFGGDGSPDVTARRPSFVMALLLREAPEEADFIRSFWCEGKTEGQEDRISGLVEKHNIQRICAEELDRCRDEAAALLDGLGRPLLRSLMLRVMNRIFEIPQLPENLHDRNKKASAFADSGSDSSG